MSPASQPSVLLLSMPWTALSEPSLGLGILKARLGQEGIPCRVRHLNLFLLEYLTSKTYFYVAEAFALNDFVFTQAFEPEVSPEQRAALETRVERMLREGGAFAGYEDPQRLIEVLLEIRNKAVPRFLEDCLAKVAVSDATLVGFTCMFDQTLASVALAKLVKEHFPEKMIVFGGYALEGPVGRQILESFPWIDAVAMGDGEDVIAPLARASLDRSVLAAIPGLLYREVPGGPVVASALPRRPANLNQSPDPDYDDFLLDVEELRRDHQVTVQFDTLPIESSRGCWWGQTRHCVFCGIDDDTMRYRQKDPDRVYRTLADLSRRHGLRQFRFSDYILPHSYYQTLLPRLAEMEEPYTLSCELKANLNEPRVRLLQAAGFVEVQPGIESFSTPVLEKMDKGVTAIQNIFTLLLGYRYGIEVHYNFLFGFPTDVPEDYEEMLRTLPLLYHLTPPISRINVATVRFAPMQTDPARFGIDRPLHHDPFYRILFSNAYTEATGFDLDNYCYYFEQPYDTTARLQQIYTLLRMQIQNWKDLHRQRKVRLAYEITDKTVTFLDSRYKSRPEKKRFGAEHARVYAAVSDQIRSFRSLAGELGLEESRLRAILDDLLEARVLYQEREQYLGLAIPARVYEDARAVERSAKWVAPYV